MYSLSAWKFSSLRWKPNETNAGLVGNLICTARADSSTANGQSVATLTISYQGEMLDLVYDLQEKAADLLDMKIDATDAATGTLTLNATKVETIVVNRATALIQPDQPDHATLRASFLEEYQSEGSPKILRTTKEYGDFELRLQFRLIGDKTNAGVQIRTAEIPDHHEVSGYQADLGDGWWGCLYDESRRRKVLAGPPANQRAKPVRMGQWNDYRILCEGKRIQLWLNGIKTVDYTESDPEIPLTGIIALQVHGNLIMEAHYRNIRIKQLR